MGMSCRIKCNQMKIASGDIYVSGGCKSSAGLCLKLYRFHGDRSMVKGVEVNGKN